MTQKKCEDCMTKNANFGLPDEGAPCCHVAHGAAGARVCCAARHAHTTRKQHHRTTWRTALHCSVHCSF